MKKNPKISVAIPVYNTSKYIIKCLDSIKFQTFKDYEIVISDDCSNDDSVLLIEKYISDNKELDIKLIKQQKNCGVSENRNNLLKICKGDYITFVDDDDYLDEDCLEELYKQNNSGKSDWIIGEFRNVTESGKLLQEQKLPLNPSKWICGYHHACLYKKEIIDKNNILFKNCGSIEDCYFTSVFASFAKNVKFVHKVLYTWVIRMDSTSGSKKKITNNNDTTMLQKYLINIKPIHDKILEEDKEILEYQIIKAYCVAIYHNYRYASINEKISAYKEMRNMMIEFNSNYRKNPLIKLNYNTPIRKYAKYIIWITITLEKLHLMPIALIGYHIVSKFYYFNI